MKFLIPLLLISSIARGQGQSDFLEILALRDIDGKLSKLKSEHGPFEERIATDGMTKTWSNEEKGIEVTFINRAKDRFALPKFEVMMVELTAFTDKGGYKDEFPFGFQMGMDHKLVKEHIQELKSIDFDKKDLSKTSSSFTYTGSPNSALQNRQIRVSISQVDGNTITSMRLRLK
ncbi:MAG: hypothetical protein K9J17_07450 [Flavobacteriales bacterium]|nr:hypothetical protein [Flavobacteriales bacterium]